MQNSVFLPDNSFETKVSFSTLLLIECLPGTALLAYSDPGKFGSDKQADVRLSDPGVGARRTISSDGRESSEPVSAQARAEWAGLRASRGATSHRPRRLGRCRRHHWSPRDTPSSRRCPGSSPCKKGRDERRHAAWRSGGTGVNHHV